MNEMSAWATTTYKDKYAFTLRSGRKEEWSETADRVVEHVLGAVEAEKDLVDETRELVRNRVFMPGGRILYAAGRPHHQTQNCVLYRAEDSREGWADQMRKGAMALMTGAGMGVDYSLLREKGAPIRKTGGTASGPLSLAAMINDIARPIRQGGSRRAAIWGGLSWRHPDIMEWIEVKNWSDDVKAMKAKDFNYPAPLDGTNISVLLDDDFFRAFGNDQHRDHGLARKVYWAVINGMLRTAEPGFSVDVGENAGETLRNACTEITSRDDSDVCNLGSVNMARINSLDEMRHAVEIGTAFLLANTVYSDVPHPEIDRTRTKNRRLGLGLMGIHEFLLKRGKRYGADPELTEYLKVYVEVSDETARRYAKRWSLSCPVKKRAIAPNGTIGIVAETATGGEPLFCVAYKRRYIDGDAMRYQYVVDPTAKRLIEAGISPDAIEDAYTLAEDVERRVEMQAYLQTYVDHAISSTINLPAWGTELNNEGKVRSFGNMLMKYLPKLRGITCYPDGCRSGQPLTRVRYETAVKHVGEVFVEQADVCVLVKGSSSCGS